MFHELKACASGQLEWFQCAPEKRPFNRTPTVLFIPSFKVSVFVVCVCMCVCVDVHLCSREPCGNSGCSLHLGSVEYLQVSSSVVGAAASR